jgi:general L-amino acid transport system permease protein
MVKRLNPSESTAAPLEEKTLTSSPVLLPPSERDGPPGKSGPVEWARKNLFSTWYNTLLTFVALALVYALLRPLLTWVLEQAQWEVVLVNLRLLLAGQYPESQLWRVWLCLHLLAATAGLTWGVWVRRRWGLGAVMLLVPLAAAAYPAIGRSARLHLIALVVVALVAFGLGRLGGKALRRTVIGAWVLYFPLVLLIIRGVTRAGWLPVVPSSLWGGLLLTFLLTVVGILVSFPLGVLLALGRRSTLPAVRWVCVAYIEVIRGVPLVTILFMAQTMVPLFLPGGVTIDRVVRAMVGITLFSAAYLAENVRGGLQAIPSGQYEAAYALGLGGFQTTALIILPQALRTVIPVLVGQFISLFKDTSLVATVGLLDLLGISRSILAQPAYIGFQREVLVFITLIYWVFSYLMSYVSQRLEAALALGEK